MMNQGTDAAKNGFSDNCVARAYLLVNGEKFSFSLGRYGLLGFVYVSSEKIRDLCGPLPRG
jgi:hypothetical protein